MADLLKLMAISLGIVVVFGSEAPHSIEPLLEMHSQEQFVEFFSPHRLGLVLYTTLDCPPCVRLTSELQSAAEIVSNITEQTEHVALAKITHDNSDVRKRSLYFDSPHDTPVTPSIGVVRHGVLERNRWRARLESITQLVEQMLALLRPPFAEVPRLEHARRRLPSRTGFPKGAVRVGSDVGNATMVVYGFFPALSAAPSAVAAFTKLGEELTDVTNVQVLRSTETEILEYYNAPLSEPSVSVFHQAMPGQVSSFKFNTSWTENEAFLSLQLFTAAKVRPLVHTLYEEIVYDPSVAVETRVMLYNSVSFALDELIQETIYDRVVDDIAIPLRNALSPRDVIAVGVRPLTNESFRGLVAMGFDEALVEGDVPEKSPTGSAESVLLVIVDHKRQTFALRTPQLLSNPAATVSTITSFVQRVRAGKELPHMMSEPATMSDKSKLGHGELITVVGRSFSSIVQKEGTVAYLLTVTDSCGQPCEDAVELMRDLAFAFRKNPTAIMAVINGPKNDMPVPFRRHDAPNFCIVPYAVKSVCEWYDGERDFGSMWRYVGPFLIDWDPDTMIEPDAAEIRAARKSKTIDDSDDQRLARATDWQQQHVRAGRVFQ